MNKVLLADDDVELCTMLKQYLETEGFQVGMVHDGKAALQQARSGRFDMMVLDIMMPQLNGLDVLRELRKASLLPVLMLTARSEDVDSIIGLEVGADDYLAKPCNPRVLVARIRALLRRVQPQVSMENAVDEPETLTVGDLVMHTGSREVVLGKKPVVMTSTEYGILEVLVKAAGHVVSKADLSEQALGRSLSRYDRSVDMHVSNLRRKLGTDESGEERIMTVRGKGYQYLCH